MLLQRLYKVMASSQRCPLPAGPLGIVRVVETLSYLVVAGVVFSWTPEPGSFGAAGLDIEESTTSSRSPLLSLNGVADAVSWLVFVVGFVLLVKNLVDPVGPGGPAMCGAPGGMSLTADDLGSLLEE